MPGVVRLLDPYPYRCPAGHPYDGVPPAPGRPCTHADGGGRAAPGAHGAAHGEGGVTGCPVCAGGPHLEEVLRYEDPESVAAVVLETVTGGNGVLVPPDGYLRSIREVCDRYGILLILDEVMAGFGRTGRWFACEHWAVVPDMMVVAKGITSGYVPLGAVVVSEPLRDWLRDHEFATGLTSTGNPIACAAGIATIEAMREEGLVERAAMLGEELGAGLAALAGHHPAVGEVRGLGLLWGIELVRDRATREPIVPFAARGEAAAPMTRLKEAAMARGLYLMTHDSLVLVAPPLVIGEEELAAGLAVLDEVLAVADEAAGRP
ncbi:MAG: aminotransferase class III-fold pyridoxal phosphate-dependent enzyme [Thermoleophilia bacterium]|nr:aminotransferase class III-fold pyridoxal phosphate-dependent enzyme [Thermoleophilia bacterium]